MKIKKNYKVPEIESFSLSLQNLVTVSLQFGNEGQKDDLTGDTNERRGGFGSRLWED